MKRIVMGLLLGTVLVACNESADNKQANSTERFPGFTQVGADGASARLYVDLSSVKQTDNLVQLKLVKALDAGYVIQDAITNCHDSFKALEGVQYRDDGTSDKQYPGDEQPLPFASKPDIAALVKKACDKAGVAQQVATPAAEKPRSDDKPKTAESALPEETADKLKTRAGLLEIARSDFNSPPDSLALNGKVIFKDEGAYLSLYRVFSFADHDAVLFASNCGGSGCPMNDFAFMVVKQGVEPTVIKADDFYAYPSAVKTAQEGNTVKLDLGFSGGKRKRATLEGEQVTVRLEDVPPQKRNANGCIPILCPPVWRREAVILIVLSHRGVLAGLQCGAWQQHPIIRALCKAGLISSANKPVGMAKPVITPCLVAKCVPSLNQQAQYLHPLPAQLQPIRSMF